MTGSNKNTWKSKVKIELKEIKSLKLFDTASLKLKRSNQCFLIKIYLENVIKYAINEDFYFLKRNQENKVTVLRRGKFEVKNSDCRGILQRISKTFLKKGPKAANPGSKF